MTLLPVLRYGSGYRKRWFKNPIRLVCDEKENALYFSRAPIPYARDAFQALTREEPSRGLNELPYRHIGIYAYRVAFLQRLPHLPTVAIERFEALEQLRALAHGYRIKVYFDQAQPPGVDAAEDLEKVRALFEDRAKTGDERLGSTLGAAREKA